MSKFYSSVAALAAATLVAGSAVALGSSSAASSVRFVTPKAGAVTKSKATFTVKISNFKINAAAVGKSPKAGQGHLHFQMDKGKFDFPKYSGANGQLAVKLGVAGTYSPAVKPTITYRNLPKGKHMSRSTSPATITRTARARRSSSPSASTGTREAEASLAGEASAHPNALRCLCSRRAYLQFLAPHQGDRCK